VIEARPGLAAEVEEDTGVAALGVAGLTEALDMLDVVFLAIYLYVETMHEGLEGPSGKLVAKSDKKSSDRADEEAVYEEIKRFRS
jgi:hypothetical protein